MNQSFKPSINIKYDFKANDLLDYYIPTPTHVEVINSICESVTHSKTQNNQIIIGAYGTGKSLLGLLISNLLSKSFSLTETESIINSFWKYDEKISTNIKKLRQSPLTFIPVFVNGNEGLFHNAILLNTLSVLEEKKIKITFNNKSTEILKTIEQWEQEYPSTFKNFKKLLIIQGTNIKQFKDNILNLQEDAYEIFEKLYSQLTSGASFNYFNNNNFISQIEQILEQLKENGLGLVFIYDEFGRFLQTLPEDKTHTTMQYIQDFAELLDHGIDNARSIFISHKDMRQYFTDKPQFIDEFQRIEKRFKKHYIYSNTNMFFSIADKIISNLRQKEIDPLSLEANLSQLRKYPLFSLNRTELETLVVQGCYPLHPVSLALLQPLSNAFGQNERTLFTFLDTTDTNGLRYHINNSHDTYYPYQLFEFFFNDINNSSTIDSKYSILKTYLKNYSKIPNNKDKTIYNEMINLLKFITLWQITNLQSTQNLTTEFISYAMGWSIIQTEQILSRLKGFRVLRYNRLFEQWQIYEGSSIDLDKEIQNKVNNLSISYDTQCSLIQSLLDKKFYSADQYNLQKKMVRFANVRVVMPEIISNNTCIFLDSDADAYINIIIPTVDITQDFLSKLQLIQQEYTNQLFCIVNKKIDFFKQDLYKYVAINQLLENTTLLSEDQYVKVELQIEQDETLFHLKQKIKYLTSFNNKFEWYLPNLKSVSNIKNELILKRKLSELFYTKYPLTPIINNEAFNRRNIATVQRNASKKVIDAIIENPDKDNFNIQGFGPDYLIYATVFKNNGIQSSIDLSNMPNNDLKKLRDTLLSNIHLSNKFADLVNILRNEPYGLRESVIPVVLVGLLQDIWPNIMFFNKGQYISRVTSQEICEMVLDGSNITYQVNNFDESDFDFFNQIVELFKDNLSQHVLDKSVHIQASSALLGWLQKLPRYCQTTSNQPEHLLLFKTYIRRLEVDPTDSLSWLKNHSNNFIAYKQELEEWFPNQIKKTLNLIETETNIHNLYSWAIDKNSQNKDNLFIQKLLKCNNENSITFINELSYQLFEFYATEWTDSFTQTFINEVKNCIESVNQTEFNPDKYVALKLNNETKYIMKTELTPRAKTLYDNLQRMITNSGKRITNNELEYILYSIIEQKLKTGEEA